MMNFSVEVCSHRQKVAAIKFLRSQLDLSLAGAKYFLDYIENPKPQFNLSEVFDAVPQLDSVTPAELWEAMNSPFFREAMIGYGYKFVMENNRVELNRLFREKIMQKLEDEQFDNASSLLYHMIELQKIW